MNRHILTVVGLAAVVVAVSSAQMRVVPVDEGQGHIALGLALRHLANTGIFLMTTAHPDDEDNGLLVMLNRGQGYRTALASATRGNGGQNEIGPEIFEALAVLRTEELAAMHRFDGAEQYFTRAVDFGYTVSIEETFEKWGREETTGDFVRLMRTIRPDVVTAMAPSGSGPGQHQHHTASAQLAHEAFKVAADPSKYADQIREGLRPWQPKKMYFRAGGGQSPQPAIKTTRCDLAGYDALLGKTYSEIGTEARSMHKCQGVAQLLALPGPSVQNYQLAEAIAPPAPGDERSLFDGIDTTINGLAKFAGGRPPKELVDGLNAIAATVQAAQKRFDADNDEATLPPLLAGLHAVRVLLNQLRTIPLDESARYEVEFRLRQKEREFQQAALAADGMRIEALATEGGIVVPGQSLKVAVILANRGSGEVAVRRVKFDGFAGEGACALALVTAGGGRGAAAPSNAAPISSLKKDQVGRCDATLKIPDNARVTEPYWHRAGDAGRYAFDPDVPFGLPFRPTPFYVQVTLAFSGGEEVISGQPVQYRYEGNIFSGEKRTELLVVPALSVRVSPDIAIVPAGAVRPSNGSRSPTAATRELRVTVVNDTAGPADTTVKLDLPKGWTATPSQQSLAFTRQDESLTVRFQLRPAPTTVAGVYHVKASASLGDRTFDRGFQVVEYPHIRRQHIYDAADTTVKVVDVKTASDVNVGYVMGAGDQVPAALEQLGAKVELMASDALAWGDLTKFDVIITGIRAYEKRPDLRANNGRLLEYVRNGGTMIVLYNRVQPIPEYGPYPGHVTNDRVTDENAPVQILEPNNPVFTTPNRITDLAWRNWVQERGLNFFSERDSRYRDLVQLEDPFPNNPGVKRGALVEAAYGKGRWLYVGLGLWRQLAAGTVGAYQLTANLVSLGRNDRARPASR
jgi:LmbE family N-acetylglucosaminyl deacetylase